MFTEHILPIFCIYSNIRAVNIHIQIRIFVPFLKIYSVFIFVQNLIYRFLLLASPDCCDPDTACCDTPNCCEEGECGPKRPCCDSADGCCDPGSCCGEGKCEAKKLCCAPEVNCCDQENCCKEGKCGSKKEKPCCNPTDVIKRNV